MSGNNGFAELYHGQHPPGEGWHRVSTGPRGGMIWQKEDPRKGMTPATGEQPHGAPADTTQNKSGRLLQKIMGHGAGADDEDRAMLGSAAPAYPADLQSLVLGFVRLAKWHYQSVKKSIQPLVVNKGLSDVGMDRVAKIAATIEFVSKLNTIAPIGSIAYLAFSTSKTPQDVIRKSRQEISTIQPHVKGEAEPVNYRDLVDRLSFYEDENQLDEYEALVYAALDKVKSLPEAVRLADAATVEMHSEEPEVFEGSEVTKFYGGYDTVWAAYKGPRGGQGWKSNKTGRVVYGREKPGTKRAAKGAAAASPAGQQAKAQAVAARAANVSKVAQAAKQAIAQGLTGQHIQGLHKAMSKMTKLELVELKKQIGLKASGDKAELKDKIVAGVLKQGQPADKEAAMARSLAMGKKPRLPRDLEDRLAKIEEKLGLKAEPEAKIEPPVEPKIETPEPPKVEVPKVEPPPEPPKVEEPKPEPEPKPEEPKKKSLKDKIAALKAKAKPATPVAPKQPLEAIAAIEKKIDDLQELKDKHADAVDKGDVRETERLADDMDRIQLTDEERQSIKDLSVVKKAVKEQARDAKDDTPEVKAQKKKTRAEHLEQSRNGKRALQKLERLDKKEPPDPVLKEFKNKRKQLAELKNARDRAVNDNDQETVKELDEEIRNSLPTHDEINGLVDHILGPLDDREKKIIRGLRMENKSLDQLGQEFGITRERVRQIQQKANKKISAVGSAAIDMLAGGATGLKEKTEAAVPVNPEEQAAARKVKPFKLTKDEQTARRLSKQGFSAAEIGERLGESDAAVEKMLASVKSKLAAHKEEAAEADANEYIKAADLFDQLGDHLTRGLDTDKLMEKAAKDFKWNDDERDQFHAVARKLHETADTGDDAAFRDARKRFVNAIAERKVSGDFGRPERTVGRTAGDSGKGTQTTPAGGAGGKPASGVANAAQTIEGTNWKNQYPWAEDVEQMLNEGKFVSKGVLADIKERDPQGFERLEHYHGVNLERHSHPVQRRIESNKKAADLHQQLLAMKPTGFDPKGLRKEHETLKTALAAIYNAHGHEATNWTQEARDAEKRISEQLLENNRHQQEADAAKVKGREHLTKAMGGTMKATAKFTQPRSKAGMSEQFAETGLKFWNSMCQGDQHDVHTDISQEFIRAHFDQQGGERPVAEPDPSGQIPWTKYPGQVNLGKLNAPSVMVHEMGHWMEHNIPGVKEAARDFLEARTAGEDLQGLDAMSDSYGGWEQGRGDEFDKAFGANGPYVGKHYTDATEIMAMGMEKMYTSPIGFAEQDPEFFKFILGVCDGSIRGKS